MKYPEDGRYKVGSDRSNVAVCTLATVEMDLPMGKIAIIGKCVTENTGIEKIVKNVLANPRIKYILCCGKESRGHFITNALTSLVKNGARGSNNEIIGAQGAMPQVKNLKQEDIILFRNKIKIIDLSNVQDKDKIMRKVNELYSRR